MKTVGALVAALLFALPAAPAATSQRVTIDRALDVSVLQRVNEVRGENGLPPLRLNVSLSRAAAAHTREMVASGYFGHQSTDGSPFWKRVERFYRSKGFARWSVGENLVWGSPVLSSDDAVQSWLESPEHRANLLSPNWTEIGLAATHVPSAPGTFGDRETTVVTADFGLRTRDR
jgi:uncharacterized protein YkwD